MDIEAVILSAARTARSEHGLRVPLTIAAVSPNGSCVFTRLTPAGPGHPAGAIEQEHVAGHLEGDGMQTPLHLLVTDATGRVLLLVQRPGAGAPIVLALADDEGA